MKRKNIYIIIGAALVTGVVVHVIVRRKKNQKMIDQIHNILDGTASDPSKSKSSGQVEVPQSMIEKLPAGNFPLKIGDKNRKVYDLQVTMNRVYGSNLDTDGKFGQGLYSALCDKYWSVCGSSVGYYGREISQKDYDAIKATTNRN